MPATIRIDFDVNAKGISEALQKELSVIQGVVASATNAMETARKTSAVRTANEVVKITEEQQKNVESAITRSEKNIAQMRAGFSAQVWGDEKKAATAIINEVAKLQEQKDKIVRAMKLEDLTKEEQAFLSSEKKKNDLQLATIRRIALENKQIAEHGAGASVGIMGIGRNIEKNFDKAAGMAKSLQGALGVAGGFTLAGLVNSANEAKEQTEAMATVLRSANVPADQLDAAIGGLKDNMNAFADEMGLSRERAREVAIEVVGITGLTGEAAAQASELALTYEKATGGVISAEKFTKLLNKNIGDPENAKSLQLLESKYPGIGAKIAAAATEQDKLNILQQAASPAMQQMAENASGLFDRIQVGFSSATDSVGEFIGANMDTIGAVGQTTATMLPLVAGFKQYAIAQKVTTAAQWLWNAAMNANPIGLVITAVAALVGGLILLYNNVEPVRKAIDGMVSWVVEAYKSFMSWVDSLGIVGKVLLAVIAPVTLVIEGVKGLVNVLGDLFGEEEEVIDQNKKLETSTNQVATADLNAADALKKRTEALVAGKKALDDYNKGLGDTISNTETQYVMWGKIAKGLQEIDPVNLGILTRMLKHEPSQAEIRAFANRQMQSLVKSVADEANILSTDKALRDAFQNIINPKKLKGEKIKLPEIDIYNLPKIELPVPDTTNFEQSIDAKLYQIKTLAEAEEFSLKLQNASKLIDEKTFEEKVYAIRLQALLDKKRLYDLEPELARKVQDEITELERNRMLALAKMQADAAKAQADAAKNSMEAFKNQVNEIQNVVSSYTDLIFKVLALGSAEKKRNDEWDAQTDKELERNHRLTQEKAKLAKTEAERNKILSTGEKERERMFDANEARQNKAKKETEEYSTEQKVKSLIGAGAAMVQAIANIIANSATLGPFGVIAAPATIAAAFAMFEAAKANLGFKDGGYVKGEGHPDGTDTVPAYLDKGEFVLRKEAVKEIGKAKLYAMNAGQWMPKFSTGGMLEDIWDQSIKIGGLIRGRNSERNTFTVSSSSLGMDSAQLVTAMDRQTEKLTAALEKKSVVLNSQRMLLTNKMAQRSRNRETI